MDSYCIIIIIIYIARAKSVYSVNFSAVVFQFDKNYYLLGSTKFLLTHLFLCIIIKCRSY